MWSVNGTEPRKTKPIQTVILSGGAPATHLIGSNFYFLQMEERVSSLKYYLLLRLQDLSAMHYLASHCRHVYHVITQ